MDLPNDVTFKIHYDGVFLVETPLSYVNGKQMEMRACSTDRVLFSPLCDLLVAKCKSNIWSLFFCIPKLSLDMDLKLIDSDKDVHSLYNFAKTHGTIEVFIAHIPQNLVEYYFKNLELDVTDEEVTSKRSVHEKNNVGVLDKNVGETCAVDNVGDTCAVDNVGVENVDQLDVVQRAIDEEVLAKQKKLDKGKGVMNVDLGKGVRKKRKARPSVNCIVIRENVDASCGNDSTDSGSETDHEKEKYMYDESDDSEESLKSFDYLSEGDDELIQLRKRMSDFKSGGVEAQEQVETIENYENPYIED